MTDDDFVASSSVVHPAATRLLIGLMTAPGALLFVVGLVMYVVSGWPIAPALVGAVVGVVGLLLLRWLSVSERSELRVSTSGLTITDAGTTRAWPWEEIRSIGVVGGAVRFLLVEDERADAAHQHRPRRDAAARTLSEGSPTATRFPLSGSEPDEATILAAVQRASRGRFPGPARENDAVTPIVATEVAVPATPGSFRDDALDLFRDDELLFVADGLDHVVTGPTHRVATIRFRSPDEPVHTQFLRQFNSARTPPSSFVVEDADDVPRLLFARAAAQNQGFELSAARADGSPIGEASAEQALFAPFPTIRLTDAAGASIGHLEGKGALEVYDAGGRRVAVLEHAQPERALFGKLTLRLQFLGDVSPELRVMAVAGVIGWRTTQSGS